MTIKHFAEYSRRKAHHGRTPVLPVGWADGADVSIPEYAASTALALEAARRLHDCLTGEDQQLAQVVLTELIEIYREMTE